MRQSRERHKVRAQQVTMRTVVILTFALLFGISSSSHSGEASDVTVEHVIKRLESPFVDDGKRFGQASADFQFAAAVASFGMLLRDSKFKGDATYDSVVEIATAAKGPDPHGYRAELLEMVRRAKAIAGQ